MTNYKELFKLMRPQQWFKSFSLLFGASVVIYEQGLLAVTFFKIIAALIAVSLLSSGVYALNDVADAEKDKMHPIKKNRPIASGKVSVKHGIILAVVLLAASLIITYLIKPWLVIIALIMLLNNLIYSFKPFRLKDIPLLDVFSAGLNFSLRVMIGWYAVTDLQVYKIIILFPFFIAGFLLSCKRLAEYKFLGRKAAGVRKVFKYYNVKSLQISINVYLTLSILGYYFFANIFNKNLFLLGPWFFIEMYWYKSFLKEKESVVKKPEDVFSKKKIFTLSGLLFCTVWLLVVLFT